MSMGDAGYQADAPAGGPMAGFDPMLGKKKKKDVVGMARRLRKEGFKSLPTEKMADKAQKIYKNGDEARGDEIYGVVHDARQDPGYKQMEKDARSRERQNRMTGKKKGYTKDISVMSRNREK